MLVDEFLTDDMIAGRRVLDVGCGLGFFSERLVQRGALVTACDLGPGLVEKTRVRARCDAVVADALRLTDAFGANQFDAVVSSECFEHTPSPCDVLKQMVAVLKPGLHGLSSCCDRNLQAARPLMINVCVLARKQRPQVAVPRARQSRHP